MKKYQKGAVNIAAISIGIAVITILLMGLALKFIYDENSELTKKNGELVQQVKTVTSDNESLNKELKLKSKIVEESNKISESHEQEVRVIYKEVEKQKKALPKPLVKEKDTKATVEQNVNSEKRIDTLWLAYCSQTTDTDTCPVSTEDKKEKA